MQAERARSYRGTHGSRRNLRVMQAVAPILSALGTGNPRFAGNGPGLALVGATNIGRL
jgi:hypothetical protein